MKQLNLQVRGYPGTTTSNELEEKLAAAIAALPYQCVRELPHSGKLGGWEWNNGWIGKHFSALFYQVLTEAFEWFQPILNQAGKPIQINGRMRHVTGFVVSVISGDQTLLVMRNEPGALPAINGKGLEVHPVLTHPIQAGVQKWFDVLEIGDVAKDPILAAVIRRLGVEVLETLDWKVAMHDSTRMKGETLVAQLGVDAELFAELVALSGGMALSREEIDLLMYTGQYLPPHTIAGLLR